MRVIFVHFIPRTKLPRRISQRLHDMAYTICSRKVAVTTPSLLLNRTIARPYSANYCNIYQNMIFGVNIKQLSFALFLPKYILLRKLTLLGACAFVFCILVKVEDKKKTEHIAYEAVTILGTCNTPMYARS